MQTEIDRIIAIAADPSVWDVGDAAFDSLPWRKRRLAARTVAQAIRDALAAAGFAIVLDEAQLFEKGGEVKLKP